MALLKQQLSILHQKTGAKRLMADALRKWKIGEEVPERNSSVPFEFVPVVKDWDKQREAYKARHPGCNVSRTTEQPSIMMLTGSSPKVCETSMGDRLLLQALKNKIDYCRPRGIEIFYNMASFDAELTNFWAKLPVLRMAMLKHPHVEWFWWVDADVYFTDMLFDMPMASYEKYEMVVPGYYDHVYKHKDWVGLNTGVFLTRNNQGRPPFEADDQSALVYLLNKHNDTLRERVFLETSYILHGYWHVLVDKYEDMMAHNSPGVIPHGNDKCPFTTHFVGCKPCGNYGEDRQRCFRQMIRAFNFADNQIIRRIGLQHVNLASWQVKPLPAVREEAVKKTKTAWTLKEEGLGPGQAGLPPCYHQREDEVAARRTQLHQDRVMFRGHTPSNNFVLVGGYRTGPRSFTAIGLARLAWRSQRKVERCTWTSLDGDQEDGTMESNFPKEHHNMTYETLVLVCTFSQNASLPFGGQLSLWMDGEEVSVYSEPGREGCDLDPQPPFNYGVTFCSPPIFGQLEARRVYEWLEFHKRVGMDHFVMYDAGGIDAALRQVLAPYIARGVLELVDATEHEAYESWAHGQMMLMHECMYRMRYASEWVVFMDMDEYFHTSLPRLTYADMLLPHRGKNFVTLGSLWWSTDLCLQQQQQPEGENKRAQAGGNALWAVERMQYRSPSIFCESNNKYPTCELTLQHYGYRKVIANPRRVISLNVHNTNEPYFGGEDQHTDIARNNHFPGLLRVDKRICNTTLQGHEKVEGWKKAHHVADTARLAKEAPLVPSAKTMLGFHT